MISLSLIAAAAAASTHICDFGRRHPLAPEELEQYAFLIGNHTIHAWLWDEENRNWGKGYLETRWNGRWTLDGFAIADEWFDVQYPGQPETTGRGINIRMWNAEKQQWSNMWMHTNSAQTTELISKIEDGKMIMRQLYPAPAQKRRVEFEVHADGSWTRIAYVVSNDGSMTPFNKIDAFKDSCAE